MTLLYYDSVFLQHETGDHPECGNRILPAARRLNLFAMHMGCARPTWKAASAKEIAAIHDAEYIQYVQRVCEDGVGQLDPDTLISSRSFDVAAHAVGAVIHAVDQVIHGDERQAFCLVRPPGHHALRDRAMGFCLFNNVAIGAERAIAKHQLDRVLIVDWDVHHGNGTQAIFWENPKVGFLSIHRFPFYPWSGAADETGSGQALGTKLNLPVAVNTSRSEYFALFERAIDTISRNMKPQLVLISAGFDAHRLDPLGSLGLESEDFGRLTRLVMNVASEYAGGRVISVLEGGYHPEAVADSIDYHLHELMQTG